MINITTAITIFIGGLLFSVLGENVVTAASFMASIIIALADEF